MRRILVFTAMAALATACGFALDGYTGGSSPTAGGEGGVESGVAGGIHAGTDANATDDPAMLVYASKLGATHSRRWDAVAGQWGAPSDGPTITSGDPVRGIVLRRSPVTGKRVLALYTIGEQTTQGALAVFDWDGSTFQPAWTSNDFGSNAGWAPFDIAFQNQSGHAIAVYGGAATGNPRVRTFDGNAWSNEQAAFATAPGGESFQFTQVVTRAGSDDTALLYTDTDARFGASRWLGEQFAPPNYLSQSVQNQVQKTFDGAFESKTGDLLIAWAADKTVEWTLSKAGSTTIPNQIDQLNRMDTGRVVMAPEPGTDRIALVSLEQICGMGTCDDFTGQMWNGTSFDPFGTIDENIMTAYDDLEADAPCTVTWNNDQAVALYHRDSKGFRWATWTGGTWALQDDYEPASLIGHKASFVPFHIAGKLGMLVEERSGSLWVARYDGTVWTDDNANAPLADDLPSPTDFNGITFATDSP